MRHEKDTSAINALSYRVPLRLQEDHFPGKIDKLDQKATLSRIPDGAESMGLTGAGEVFLLYFPGAAESVCDEFATS